VLYGRDQECAEIDRLLARLRAGRCGTLALLGEPGVGKSALLAHALSQADDLCVLRAVGVESESELAFATLHQLLRPVLGLLPRLPPPQARALGAALGLTPPSGPAPLALAAGVLTLLSEAAEDRPVLCVVDDLQWADQPSIAALGFAARRLEAEGVLLLMAAREDALPPSAIQGMEVLRLSGLDRDAAAALLADRGDPRLATQVRDRLIAMTDGNPLGLIELPALLSGGQLSGEAPLPDPLPLSDSMRRAFAARVRHLDPPVAKLLLLAAADDSADPGTLLRAAERLGLDGKALETAEAANLLRIQEGAVVFRHPLVRSAAYQSATAAERREAHRILATVLDGDGKEDRRAWHLAAATLDPDEQVAVELERSAGRATQRAGYAAAASALERAAELTADEDRRSRRLTAAADAAWLAGQAGRARALLHGARPLAVSALARAELAHVQGRLEVTSGAADVGYRLLLEGADQITPSRPDLAASMLLEATQGPWLAGDLGRVGDIAHRLARLPGERSGQEAGLIQFATGAELFLAGDVQAATEVMREVLGQANQSEEARQLIMAGVAALVLADDNAALELATRVVAWTRAQSLIGWLPLALMMLATAEALTGRYTAAAADACEGLLLARETGQRYPSRHCETVLAFVAAVRGDKTRCREHAGRVLGDEAEPRTAPATSAAVWALGLLDLGLGDPQRALERLLPASSSRLAAGHPIVLLHATGDLVEAAVRAGHQHAAQEALAGNGTGRGFASWAAATAQPWALAVASRCRALLAWDEDPEPSFAQALRLHQGGSRPFELARTELAYGEWLRRVRRRRSEARVHLRAALELFERLGATPWSQRARLELRAAGETIRPGPRDATQEDVLQQLTPQELQVARLAAQGGSNRDIAAQLFLSPRTVGYHLNKVFTKLGIASRRELIRLNLDRATRNPGQMTDSHGRPSV
jgi:DNA-binding CsgD family transcriptional regulator